MNIISAILAVIAGVGLVVLWVVALLCRIPIELFKAWRNSWRR